MIVDISEIEVTAIRYAIDGLSDQIEGGSERNHTVINYDILVGLLAKIQKEERGNDK